jgi:gamma-glutamyltranspeptidase/glutathione hydrolase
MGQPTIAKPAVAKHGMVATTHPLAAEIGVEVLKSGGNAMDAAIAANAAMGLMEPMSCGVGGDLFAIVYWQKGAVRGGGGLEGRPIGAGRMYGLNASGRSPLKLSLETFRAKGITEIPMTGPLSWSVPGCVDGWRVLLDAFGTRGLGDLLQPAIHYASAGFPVPRTIAGLWKNNVDFLQPSPDAVATYLPDGKPPLEGETFRNPRLGETYRLLAEQGPDAFYKGTIAKQIVEFSAANGGYFSLEDFARHTSTWVEPVSSNYRGYDVFEIPPPGQGISVLQILNILEGFDLGQMGRDSADWWHLFAEAKKLAYADRGQFYADPEFVTVPTQELISKKYAAKRRERIDMRRAAAEVPFGNPEWGKSDTIYMTVVDKDRNCVSLIQSVYRSFGSGLVPGKLGFALQNRGTLFALDEKHPNCFAPGKRPFHTIIPSFVMKNDKPHFCFGVMGGDMQPQGQVQVLVNMIDFGMNIHDAGAAPRMMHEGSQTPTGKPANGVGSMWAEKEISQATLDDLKSRGHQIAYGPINNGGYQGILLDETSGVLQGASETRRDGRAVGY